MNMSRFAPYLGIVAALTLGVFLVTFSGSVRTLLGSSASTSPTAALPGVALAPITLPAPNDTSVKATSTTKKNVPIAPKSPSALASSSVSVATLISTSTSSGGNVALDAAASTLRNALVNIICYVPAGSGLHSISGSGVIIDPKGIILTNAHIAQYFLLGDRGVSCMIRTGSPAIDKYKAALIFISPTWIHANADVLTQANPSGTGEYDFGLLAILKSATTDPLPLVFPSIPLALTPPLASTPIVIASYGAQFLEANQVQSSLFPTLVFGSVKEVFTFVANTIDVLALGGSAAAQEGSSGGGIADASGNLVGTIMTSTIDGPTDTRSLNALTASYIRADYASETGSAIDLLLAEPTLSSVLDFSSQRPALEAIITASILGSQ